METKVNIHEGAKYILNVPEGTYSADTMLSLLWAVFKHRCWHLFRGDGWVD